MTPSEFDSLNLEQGSVIKMHWLDIYEDSVGDTRKAELGLRLTLAFFWEKKLSHDVECAITCNTIDKDPSQQGWCCTPISLISKIEVIKRPSKRKKNVRKAEANVVHEVSGGADQVRG